jgi:hypothetical protein
MYYLDQNPRLKFSCIYAGLDTVQRYLLNANERAISRGAVSVSCITFDRRIPAFGPPTHSRDREAAIFAPSIWSEGCILKSNASDGFYPLVLQISHRLACKTIHWELSAPSVSEADFVNAFYFNDCGDKVRRVARCMREESGRWEFFAAGELQVFERPEYYSRKRYDDRMNRQILLEYLLALGMDVKDDAFWSSKGEMLILEVPRGDG